MPDGGAPKNGKDPRSPSSAGSGERIPAVPSTIEAASEEEATQEDHPVPKRMLFNYADFLGLYGGKGRENLKGASSYRFWHRWSACMREVCLLGNLIGCMLQIAMLRTQRSPWQDTTISPTTTSS